MDDTSDSPPAGNDNDPGPRPEGPPLGPYASAGPGGNLLLLRLQPDTPLQRLNALMDDIYVLAKDSIEAAGSPANGIDEHDTYVKQSVALTSCFAKLLAAANRHREILKKEK